MNLYFPRNVNQQDAWITELSHITTNQQKICFDLYFKAYDKLIDENTNYFQQPDFLHHKYIEDVFVQLRNRNKHGILIGLVVKMDQTVGFKLGDLSV